ncbi:MAG: hypothetical protein JWP92_3525 [Caulobacter sp.]|nr:hypothetical protein [Caulobacter sp.]
MSAGDRPARTRAPISLQLVALLVLSLLVAQALSFATILLTPPPRPAVYGVADIAGALRGGPLMTPRWSRPLTRTVVAVLPPDLRRPQRGPERTLPALAGALRLPEARVRLAQHPSPMWSLMRRVRPVGPSGRMAAPGGPAGPGSFGREDRLFAGDPDLGPPRLARPGPEREVVIGGMIPGRARGFSLRFGPDQAVFGDFAAAMPSSDGGWVVVRSTPEPFPTDWQKRTALWLLAGLLVVAPAGYLFARRITAPLKRFADAAEALGRDPHAPQMTLTGPAEVGAAARAFNDMQARLKRYVDDRTAMVGAISHDLRTPLARIRFKMERAPQPLRDSVIADLAQMEQMIGGVLAFIRHEGEPRRRERLDLLSLIECVADDAALVGGDVEIVSGEPVTVDGDPVALQRLFANLVDNALKYGQAARIRVRRADDAAVVEIADQGPGLASDELERVFKPFYRADSSRNPDTGGVGLGLSIARSTARAHGGDVTLRSTVDGLVATVSLPAG